MTNYKQQFKDLINKELYKCEECGGSGKYYGAVQPDDGVEDCETCKGSGYVIPLKEEV